MENRHPRNFGPPIATYHMFDAFTGDYMLTFANGMPGAVYFGKDGTMFVDVLNGTGRMARAVELN